MGHSIEGELRPGPPGLLGGRSDQVLNLARVGRAPGRLNTGQEADVAADAALVPEGFSYESPYSSADESTKNKIYALMDRELVASVEVGYRDMEFQGVQDPRVVAVDLGVRGSGTDIEIWGTARCTSLDSPVPVATWEKAQLMQPGGGVYTGQICFPLPDKEYLNNPNIHR